MKLINKLSTRLKIIKLKQLERYNQKLEAQITKNKRIIQENKKEIKGNILAMTQEELLLYGQDIGEI